MVKSAVADIVSPAVTAQSPYGFLHKIILVLCNTLAKSDYYIVICVKFFDFSEYSFALFS